MNRFVISTTTLFLITYSLFGQSCLPEGIRFTTQQEIDNFLLAYPNCTEITGTLIIESSTDINHLQGLKNIERIEGDLLIKNSNSLINLNGLEQLEYVGGKLLLEQNDNLIDLSGLESLLIVNKDLSIETNKKLKTLDGVDNLQKVGGSFILLYNTALEKTNDFLFLETIEEKLSYSNNGIQHLKGFKGLVSVGGLHFLLDFVLETIAEFPNLSKIGSLQFAALPKFKRISIPNNIKRTDGIYIANCESLTDIRFLSSIDSVFGSFLIDGCTRLENLDGVDNLKFISPDLRILRNPSLKNISALRNLNRVQQWVVIDENPMLESLDGLENLSFDDDFVFGATLEINNNATLTDITALTNLSFTNFKNLIITQNSALSVCNIPSVCAYLETNGGREISNNLCGCNSTDEVLAACAGEDINISIPMELFETICEGTTYQFGTSTLSNSGIYSQTLPATTMGCDSTVRLNLTVLEASTTNLTATIAMGETYFFNNQNLTDTGEYTDTLMNINGCDSIVFLQLTINAPQVAFQVETGGPSCATSNDGFLEVIIRDGVPPFQFSIDNGTTYTDNPLFENLPAGSYQVKIKDSLNEETLAEAIDLESMQFLSISLGEDQQIRAGQSLSLTIDNQNFSPVSYQWTSNQDMSCTDCANPTIYPKETDDYYLTATDENGCSTADTLLVEVLPTSQLFIPSVFSPNGDGINDQFSILGLPHEIDKIQALKIFDRWGNLVFQSTATIDAIPLSWNGEFNGRIVPMGVYIYQLKMINEDGRIDVLMGDIMLVK